MISEDYDFSDFLRCVQNWSFLEIKEQIELEAQEATRQASASGVDNKRAEKHQYAHKLENLGGYLTGQVMLKINNLTNNERQLINELVQGLKNRGENIKPKDG